MVKINPALTDSEVNHLRRLLGYMRCEVGQTPDEIVETMRGIAPTVGPISDDAKARMVAHHAKAASIPKYVRAAIKALEKTLVKQYGEVVDVDVAEVGSIAP